MGRRVHDFIQTPPGMLAWVVGDAPAARDALANYSWKSSFVLLKILDSLLRGVAQVVFANNPVSGLLVLAGLFVGDVTCGLAAVVCSLTAIFVAKLLNWPNDAIEAGLTSYSAVLVGTVTAALYPAFFHQPLSPAVWGYMVLASVFSVCVLGGLGRILAVHSIPAYTLPFNVGASLIFVCLRAAGYYSEIAFTDVQQPDLDVKWDQMWLGCLLSGGQVWAVESVFCSCLVLLSLLLFSPILAVVSFMGAALGTFTALMVSSPPYSLVYAGVWGYNGFLAAGSIAFFMVPTPKVILLAAINAVFATFIQGALTNVLATNHLPVFTFPFCLASVVFLATAMGISPSSLRVTSPSFPELHLVLNSQKMKTTINMNAKEEFSTTTEEAV